MVHAQNDKDEEDRDMAYVMRDLLEYNVQRSNYELSFLYAVISALVNPVTYFKICYAQSEQEVWARGKKKKKAVKKKPAKKVAKKKTARKKATKKKATKRKATKKKATRKKATKKKATKKKATKKKAAKKRR